MPTKNVIMVCAGVFLITNIATVLTLYFSGHFDQNSVPEPVEEEATAETVIEPVEPPPIRFKLKSLTEAMYICEDRFLDATKSINKSYEFKSSESRFMEEDALYQVFIEFTTVSKNSAPSQMSSVICEVSAQSGEIAGYKVLPLD